MVRQSSAYTYMRYKIPDTESLPRTPCRFFFKKGALERELTLHQKQRLSRRIQNRAKGADQTIKQRQAVLQVRHKTAAMMRERPETSYVHAYTLSSYN